MEPARKHTYADYLAFMEDAEVRHEFIDGQIVAMAGGSIEHARLTSEVAYLIRQGLEGSGCRVFSSDGRVRIESTDNARYPDLSIVCGEVEFASDDPHAITNPRVIVEVLSPSTERDDRGAKFAHYKRLPSLQEYVLVSQDSARVEVFRRQPDGWLHTEQGPGEVVTLGSVDVRFEVDALYRDAI